MTERAEGFYWVRVRGHPPEVALWGGDVWFLAGTAEGYVPEAVAVLGGPLAPPWPDPAPVPAAPCRAVPRLSVRWAVPPCGGEADTSGVLNGGDRA